LERLFSFAGDEILNPIVQTAGDVVSGFGDVVGGFVGAGEPDPFSTGPIPYGDIAPGGFYTGGIGMRDGGMMGFRPLGMQEGGTPIPSDVLAVYQDLIDMTRDATTRELADYIEQNRSELEYMAGAFPSSQFDFLRATLERFAAAPLPPWPTQAGDDPRARYYLDPPVNPREKVLRDAREADSFPEFQELQPTIGVSEPGWRALQEERTITEEDPELLGTPAYQQMPIRGDVRLSDQAIGNFRGMRNGGIMTLRRY
jgi:hypothetical protein